MLLSIPVLPTISTLMVVLSAVMMAFGWKQIRRKKTEEHMRFMLLAAVFAAAFFVIYSFRTVYLGNTAFGGPENYKVLYTVLLLFHIVLATLGAVLGIVSLYSGWKKKISRHKRLGPVTSVVWFFTAFSGVAVYLFLYVFFESGATTSIVKAIIGG